LGLIEGFERGEADETLGIKNLGFESAFRVFKSDRHTGERKKFA